MMTNAKEKITRTNFAELLKNIAYGKARFLLLFIGGFLTGLTLVLPKLGFLEWITLIPVGVVLLYRVADRAVRLRSLYFEGFVLFYTYYLVCFHWFTYLYPLDFVEGMTKGAALVVVIAAWFGLSLLQALMSALVFVAAGVVCRCRLCVKLTILKPFLCAGLWAICEWSQTIGWWGVPWGRLPIGQTEYLIGLQNASLLGSYFVTFMLVSVNLLLAYAIIEINDIKKLRMGAFLAVALLLLQYGSGTLLYFTTDVNKGEKIKVACVQGNISSSEKWNVESNQKTLDNYCKYTEKAAAEGAELVIWPETAIPYDISTTHSYYARTFSRLAKDNGIYLLVGAYVSDDEGNSLNSLICYTPMGKQIDTVYSKRHLVPFGEYVPLRPLIETLIPPLANLVLSSDDIYPGKGAQIIQTESGIGLGGLICFDSIYEELTLESVREGAELICLSTNDSWFIDSAALYMHNAQAQIRAIESGRYVARAANTGVSTVINPRGEVLCELGALVEGIVVCDVYANGSRTVWSVIGNAFIYCLITIYLALVCDNIVYKKILKFYKEKVKNT